MRAESKSSGSQSRVIWVIDSVVVLSGQNMTIEATTWRGPREKSRGV